MPKIEKSPTPLSLDELVEIGAHVVQLCGTFQALGHVSPAGSIDPYITRPDTGPGGFVWDMFSVCRVGGDPAASARLADFSDRHGLLDLIAEAVTR